MKIIRFQQKRFFICLIFFLAVLCVAHYIFWSADEDDIPECFLPEDDLRKVEKLLIAIHDPLKALNLTYFLCYNSLWGALKMKGPLPWQNALELCVLNKQISAIDEGFLARSFRHSGLSITYNSAGGFYTVFKFGETVPSATLTVFEEDPITRQMRRIGWIHRMLPPNSCEELNCFPPELIAHPLPTVTFGQLEVPAPRDGIEIQKYLFPYSWWKEITPSNCRETNQ
ncbi:uncharacterized protein LOC118192611 [Stegodyphus dumicola]|uniref:uncharacterized protein LOC118192611 n=1 Tax=Stegodyphus dumicola TaxID=202533 RepID=UPI0015B28560|nr:uncharacterized protein LOC118192611 [Stegodyphus dumicola]XP_035219502.1 uncharacterized protein LOC118192611 [Stegodyphus dumicola]XP_035219505.1 uncharacterized protein LOC118192611 [Stegodyphus dumicola]